MVNLRHKKNTYEEKNIFRQKWLRKMHLKNLGFTYKSKILKLKIKQKVFYKKMRNDTFKCSKFSLYQLKITFIVFKCTKNAIFSKNSRFFCYFFTQKMVFRKNKENWEQLNVSLRIFFVQHFLLYLELSNSTFIRDNHVF